MHIYNSFSKSIEKFEPEEGKERKEIVVYVCGLTPYDKAHIGHARTCVAFDIVKRFLLQKGCKVLHIQNITDVDDKIIKRCRETGADPKKLTEENHREALELFDKLGILRADIYPKVTGHIREIVELVQKLIQNGHAYETETGVYFDVSKFKNYGTLSGQKKNEIIAGSRKEVDETKDDPADFALWKKTDGDLIEFNSPWGTGRPGWHIECSAMGLKYAKEHGKTTIDIHGGARDLIFPHHENEIAQSEAANGKQFVKYWMHTGFLTVNGEKMSKSLGNFITVADVLSKYEPNAVRMFFALAHYRSPIDYNEEQIEAAGTSAERILNARGLIEENLKAKEKGNSKNKKFAEINDKLISEMHAAMENDFDTPNALAALFNLIRAANTHLNEEKIDYAQLERITGAIKGMIIVIGITDVDKAQKTDVNAMVLAKLLEELGAPVTSGILPEEKSAESMLDELVMLRDKFRKTKEYVKSDKIRDELGKIGIVLEDDKGKTKWKVK